MRIFRVEEPKEYAAAAEQDLIRLRPSDRSPAVCVPRGRLELLVAAMASGSVIHLSGPTGTAKTSLIEALADAFGAPPQRDNRRTRRGGNFQLVLRAMGIRDLAPRPLIVFPVEMVTFDTSSELYGRRAIVAGNTVDEDSRLVQALCAAQAVAGEGYPLIWLREIGRVHSAAIQSGLLNLISKAEITLPDGRRIDGRSIGWIADSNYAAADDADHTLVAFDTALQRRFSVNLTMEHLPVDAEAAILRDRLQGVVADDVIDGPLIEAVVLLGSAIRQAQAEGRLRSLPTPSIQSYESFLQLAALFPGRDPRAVARATLLGNAASEDREQIPQLLEDVFGAEEHLDGRLHARLL